MEKIISKIEVVCQYSNGKRNDAVIRIGEPYYKDEIWWVYVDIDCIAEHKAPVAGGDSFQALCLAISFVETMMIKFMSGNGAMIYIKSDESLEEFPLSAYFSHLRSPTRMKDLNEPDQNDKKEEHE